MKQFVMAFTVLVIVLSSIVASKAQNPSKPEPQLRFDEAQREELAELPHSSVSDSLAVATRYVCKLNRKRVSEAEAYDAVTLWNVHRVRVKHRTMRLSDSTRRERVELLKFRLEKNRQKATRPHLLGNVAGYYWSSGRFDHATHRFYKEPLHIGGYTRRDEYAAVIKASGGKAPVKVPDSLWRDLPPEAVYLLDGERVSAHVFQFVDGLILRTLEIRTDSASVARYEAPAGVVIGDIYPDRRPLVLIGGHRSSIAAWLRMCRADAFSMEAAVPLHYYYMLPLEAVQRYGKSGMYGAICIDPAQ